MSDIDHKNVEEELAELLKRCSPDTLEAAIAFRKTKDLKQIETIVLGVIDRHLEPEQRDIF
ncbi:MAG: FabA-like domain protein, partial [Opitutae bacterium]